MRTSLVLVAVLLVWGPLALAQQTEADRQKEILKELRALRESVDELNLRVQALEKKLNGTASATPNTALPPGVPPEVAATLPPEVASAIALAGRSGSFQRHGADLQALAKITLPEKPTKDQVREYVNKIMAASQGQNSFGSDDPQVTMLERVGPGNLDVLLQAYNRHGNAPFYLQYAIVNLARPEHKDQILKMLPAIPDLAKVIMNYGWEEDAKDTLISGLETTTDYLPSQWMRATAALKSPEAVKALKLYLIRGQNREEAYNALAMMPNAGDLAPAVASAWRACTSNDPWNRTEMAKIAVAYGHVDAIGYIIDQLNAQSNYYDKGPLRSLVLRYTSARGSNQDLADWYNKNKANIVWDAKDKVYKVKKAVPAAP